MKKMLVVLGLTLVTVCVGQYLEKTIWLYDSFPPLGEPYVALHNPVTNRMYMAGWQDIQIYDAGLRRKHAYLGLQAEWMAAIRCPDVNRIYFSADESTVVAFDDRADTVVALLNNVTERPWSLAYSAASQQLYVADWDHDWVVALEARGAAILDTIGIRNRADRLVWDPFRDRLYCAGQRWGVGEPVQVVDCVTHSVVYIPGTGRTADVVVHPDGDRLYCLGVDSARTRNVLRVVDADSLVVRDSLILPTSDDWGGHGRLVPNPAAGRLYACWLEELSDGPSPPTARMQDTVVVIDLTSDTVVGLIGFPEGYWQHVFAVSDSSQKVFFLALDCESLVVIGPSDSVEAVLSLAGADEYAAIGWNPFDNAVYVGQDDSLWIIDCDSDSIMHSEDYRGFNVRTLQWNQPGNKLYLFDSRKMSVFGPGDTLGKSLSLWSEPWPLGYCPELNKLYLHKSGRMGVLDCALDSIVKVLEFTPTLTWDGFVIPGMPKMYVPEGHSTAVFDLVSDSLVYQMGFTRRHFVYNPNNGMVYAFRSGLGEPPLLVVDPVEDGIRKWITMPGRCVGVAMDVDRNLAYCLPDYGFDHVYIVNCSSDVVVDSFEIPTGITYENLLMLDDVDKLYVYASQDVAVVDCETRTVLKTLGRGVQNERDPGVYDTRTGWFWMRGRENVFVLDCHSDSIITDFEVEVSKLALDSATGRVYGGHEKVLYVFGDTLTGAGESPRMSQEGSRGDATVIRGMLRVPTNQPADLLDIAGRRVMSLQPGENVIRHLAPGVYFVREEGPRGQGSEGPSVQKIVIQR